MPLFPTVPSLTESSVNTAGTSHAISTPASLVPGNILLILTNKGSGVATFDALAGYTELLDENIANGMTVWVHTIDGTEGSTVTFTSSANTRSASIIYQISGAEPLSRVTPELSTVATGTSVNPDATTVTPAAGTRDYLYITFFGMAGEEADDDTWVTGTPTNFTNLRQKSCGTAGTNLGGLIGSAARSVNSSSQDAGQFTVAVSAAWRAYTIAFTPPVPPISPTLPTMVPA